MVAEQAVSRVLTALTGGPGSHLELRAGGGLRTEDPCTGEWGPASGADEETLVCSKSLNKAHPRF